MTKRKASAVSIPGLGEVTVQKALLAAALFLLSVVGYFVRGTYEEMRQEVKEARQELKDLTSQMAKIQGSVDTLLKR